VVLVDASRRITFANPAAEQILGRAMTELHGNAAARLPRRGGRGEQLATAIDAARPRRHRDADRGAATARSCRSRSRADR
jgi:nitrogen-specific signal transduction histidine kinase